MWSGWDDRRGRKGEVFKSLIAKEAIGGGFSNPRSKVYSNGFLHLVAGLWGQMVCAHRAAAAASPGLSNVLKSPACESTDLASPLSLALLCQQVVCQPGNRPLGSMVTIMYIFFSISFLGRGSQAFCHQRTIYGLRSRVCREPLGLPRDVKRKP